MKRIRIYDTTLRDGCQAEGVNLSVEDKLRVAQRLDAFGVAYIEGGWPNETNPQDQEFFRRARDMEWQNARISAFGSTRRGIYVGGSALGPEDIDTSISHGLAMAMRAGGELNALVQKAA